MDCTLFSVPDKLMGGVFTADEAILRRAGDGLFAAYDPQFESPNRFIKQLRNGSERGPGHDSSEFRLPGRRALRRPGR